jgi:hypothetical protein
MIKNTWVGALLTPVALTGNLIVAARPTPHPKTTPEQEARTSEYSSPRPADR